MYKHIIDAHAHIFPDKIAEKASIGIGSFYSLHMEFDGSVNSLIKQGDECGIDGFIVQSVATTVHQVESINNFIHDTVSAYKGRMFGFATLHPDMPNPKDEVDRVISMGFKGIKIHPDFQRFALDSESAYRLFDAIDNRLPVLVHTGDKRYKYSNPDLMLTAALRYPDTKFIAAHFGGWDEWESAEQRLCGIKNVWVDSSSSFYAMSEEEALRLIYKFGINRVFFGTDFPMWPATNEIEFVDRLKLTAEEKEMLMWKNISDFLQLGYK